MSEEQKDETVEEEQGMPPVDGAVEEGQVVPPVEAPVDVGMDDFKRFRRVGAVFPLSEFVVCSGLLSSL